MSTADCTPKGVLSYPKLTKPTQLINGSMGYTFDIVFPKGTDLSGLKKRIEEVGKEAGMKKVSGDVQPLKDGNSKYELDNKKYALYKDAHYISFSIIHAEDKPLKLYDHTGPTPKRIVKEGDILKYFYPGAIVQALINITYNDKYLKKRVSCYLEKNILARKEVGKRIGGSSITEEEGLAALGIDINDLEDDTGEDILDTSAEDDVSALLEG